MEVNEINGITIVPPLCAEYRLDPVVEVNQDVIATEQGYHFDYYQGLKSSKDVTFNKDTNFYLTDLLTPLDIINIKPLSNFYPKIITTYLAFNRLNVDPLSGLMGELSGSCLTGVSAVSGIESEDQITEYLLPNTDTHNTTGIQEVIIDKFVDLKSVDILPQNYYFHILLKDSYNCLIFSEQDSSRYYLREDPDNEGELYFQKIITPEGLENNIEEILTSANSDGILFQYTYFQDQNLFRFYKQDLEGGDKARIVKLREPGEREGKIPIILTTEYDTLTLNGRDTLRLRRQPLDFEHIKISNNIVNYEQNLSNNLNVNENTSSLNVKNNNIIHSEYYYLTGESIPINILPLKNQQTDSGYSSPTSPWIDRSEYNHREYNKIYTGTEQLEGTDKIYTQYTSTTTEIVFNPGITYFNLSPESSPYKRLNVNDSGLIESGSIAADRPIRSDKIFKRRAGYPKTTRWGDPKDMHTGTWLCTWLSGADDHDSEPVWMDRYYNPKSTGHVEALSFSHEGLLGHAKDLHADSIYTTSVEIYDEPSNLTFEPGSMYAYYRVDNKCIDNSLKHLDPYHLKDGLDVFKETSGDTKDTGDVYKLDGNSYGTVKVNSEDLNTGEVSINFDIESRDWKKSLGHSIVGNYTNNGFALCNENKVSPFVFVMGTDGTAVQVGSTEKKQDTSVRIYNNEFKLINYITNDSHLDTSIKPPGFFKYVVVRDTPDDVYSIMTTGEILQFNHSGTISYSNNSWNMVSGRLETDEIVSVCSDDTYIYILTQVGNKTKTDYTIHTFNTVTKQFDLFSEPECVFNIPVPGELTTENLGSDYGRNLDSINTPPNIIQVKDDAPPYTSNRVVYIGYGDRIRVNQDKFWIEVKGSTNDLTGIQENHDTLYCFDVRKLELMSGQINSNNQNDDIKLSIIDYQCDIYNNIWILHAGNKISKLDQNKRLIFTLEIEDQEILSLVPTKTIKNNKIVESVVVLGKTVGGEVITVPILNHPTKAGPAANKASPWQDTRVDPINNRPRSSEDILPINNRVDDEFTPIDETEFDDTLDIIYPFVAGNDRFGNHTKPLNEKSSADVTGSVPDGDYMLITELFDLISTESVDQMYGNVITSNGEIVEQLLLSDFVIDNINDRPGMINSYSYHKSDFEQYPQHNLNLKVLLTPNHDISTTEKINIPVDISELSPGKHNFNINFNSKIGELTVSIDSVEMGRYDFEPNKYFFNNILDSTIVVGATPYINDTLLIDKIKDLKSYTVSGATITNFSIYNKCLNTHDVMYIMRKSEQVVSTFMWAVPNGLRNMVEGIDRVFNHSIPASKSAELDLRIRNSKITNTDVQNYITNKIRGRLDSVVPAGTDTRNILWSNQILT